MLRTIIVLLTFCASLVAIGNECVDSVMVDTISMQSDDRVVEQKKPSKTRWIKQLFANGFHINDPAMEYPKFPRFVVDVYNWGDSTFNGYDSEYVVGSGKNWKVFAKSYNWLEYNVMLFKSHQRLQIHSDFYNDLGAHLSFMAVSVGYTKKIDRLFGSRSRGQRHNFNFGFTCSRFTVNLDYTTTEGDATITKFGSYKGKYLPYSFDDVDTKSLVLEMYYFFNHRRYSQAAAYCFSKYQLKNAGSWIIGMNLGEQKINLDFSGLPQDFKRFLPGLSDKYQFHYSNYNLSFGYAYNWAIVPRRWLINATILPSLGYRYSYRQSSEGPRHMVGLNATTRFAAVYNHRALFAGAFANFHGRMIFNEGSTLFNSQFSASLIVGARF